MTIFQRLVALLFAMLVSVGGVFAQSTDEVAIPALTNYAVDTTESLTSAELESLNARLKAFEEESGSQIFVLIVPTVEPEGIDTYAVRVFETWKVGRQKFDDGVLFVMAKNDRRMRIEVGYGLEGAIPDLMASRILNNYVTPYLREGDFAGGIDSAVTQLMTLIRKEELPPPKHGQASSEPVELDTISIIISSVLIGFLAVFLAVIFHPVLGGFIAGMTGLAFSESGMIALIAAGGLIAVAWWVRRRYGLQLNELKNKRGLSKDSKGSHRRSYDSYSGGFSSGSSSRSSGGGFGGGGGGRSGGGGASGGW